jgi:DNA-directed RNA polymerase subunit E'
MVYKILTIRDSVRVYPKDLAEDKRRAIYKSLQQSLEGLIDKDIGIILAIVNVGAIGEGMIIPEDGGVYYETVFDILTFQPEIHEVIEGAVIEIAEFGAFVRLGPLDGLVHISQVTDDFMSYSKDGVLMGRDSKKILKSGDKIRAKIITVSFKQAHSVKIGLTMRQQGLGKLEWLEEEMKKKEKEKK